MPSRRGGSRTIRQLIGESRAPGSDEEVEQQTVPLRRRARQPEVEESRLKLAVLQLRDHAQRWWKGTSRVMRESGVLIAWTAAGLAMETSKVESVVRNQAEAKLNQLEHSESAGTIRTSCKR
ncbi:hypothetical protein F511_16507 [Dorcoceras hygrometricum]|uniref:Uncharacterized protein n=1 Tax=Dorcoceras hygrometricum TaxID=472368 RepID=A0A2Z7CZG3_9LAMI|nr:hypothetical protein F511_16507 [Dorcoceras hygrometricum]